MKSLRILLAAWPMWIAPFAYGGPSCSTKRGRPRATLRAARRRCPRAPTTRASAARAAPDPPSSESPSAAGSPCSCSQSPDSSPSQSICRASAARASAASRCICTTIASRLSNLQFVAQPRHELHLDLAPVEVAREIEHMRLEQRHRAADRGPRAEARHTRQMSPVRHARCPRRARAPQRYRPSGSGVAPVAGWRSESPASRPSCSPRDHPARASNSAGPAASRRASQVAARQRLRAPPGC